MQKLLRVFPNPFSALDHQGLPAGTYALDPTHGNGSRGWVGARVDRSPAADGSPKTRPLPQPGDLQKTIRSPDGSTRVVHVDRAPRKRIVFAHDVEVATPVPDLPHYRFGLRGGNLLVGDAATAKIVGVPFTDPKAALKTAATRAIATWTKTYGEPAPVDTWPASLRAVAGLDAPAPPPATVASVLAEIPAAAAAAKQAGEPTFTLASWDPTDAAASGLYAAVVAALTAAGLSQVTEGMTRVGGAATAHSITISLADLAAAQTAAAKKAAATPTVPSWLGGVTPSTADTGATS